MLTLELGPAQSFWTAIMSEVTRAGGLLSMKSTSSVARADIVSLFSSVVLLMSK